MRIAWSVEALADLTAIIDYLDAQAPEAAAVIAARVSQTERVILTIPKAARYDNETDTYDKYVPKTRLNLTYRIVEDEIRIIRVWHTSRDPETRPNQ